MSIHKRIADLQNEKTLLEQKLSSLQLVAPDKKMSIKKFSSLNDVDHSLVSKVILGTRKGSQDSLTLTKKKWNHYLHKGLKASISNLIQKEITYITTDIADLEARIAKRETKQVHVFTTEKIKEDASTKNEIDEFCRAINDGQKHSPSGKFTWSVNKELAELLKKNKISLSKNSLPVIDAAGVNDSENLPGVPLWAFISYSEILHEFNPQKGLEFKTLSDVHYFAEAEIMNATEANKAIPFFAAKKLWNGPAHILDCFGADAARIYASIGSTNVRGVYQTPQRDVSVFVVNLSDKASVQALMEKHPTVISDPKAAMQWMGEHDSSVEVDGMSICGNYAMPGKTNACQMRAIAMHDKETLNSYRAINDCFSETVKALDADNEDAYNAGVDASLAMLTIDHQPKVRYAKGMLAQHDFIADRVILLDLNMLKGRDKTRIKEAVKKDGFVKANDLVVGLLQDIGSGAVKLSWQGIMYFLSKLPKDFPTKYKDKATDTTISMVGRTGFGPAMTRAFQLLNKSLDAYSTGIIDKTMQQIFNTALSDGNDKESITTLIKAMWNNPLARRETQKWIMNFLRNNKYLFQTEGMEKDDKILPEKRYLLDMNSISKEPVTIELHDGRTHNAYTAFLKDNNFWKNMGVDEIPVVMFRHPISDFSIIDVFIFRNPNAFGWNSLPPGIHANSWVIKEVLVGDTDGDIAGYFPLWTPVKPHYGPHPKNITSPTAYSLQNYTEEDYCALYTIISRDVQPRETTTNVERYLEKISNAPQEPYLLKAEKVMNLSAAMIGSAALLQSQIIRFNDAVLKGLLVGHKPTIKKINAIILEPLRKEMPAILELCISLQKKTVDGALKDVFKSIIRRSWKKYSSDYIFKAFFACIYQGQHYPNEATEKMLGKLAEDGIMPKFIPEWATAVAKLIKSQFKLLHTGGVQIKYSKTTRAIGYSTTTASRLADQVKNDDPSLTFGVREDENWGIMNESNLQDGLAVWSNVFNKLAKKLKKRVLELTSNHSVEGQKTAMTNANRCVSDLRWRHIVPKPEVTQNELAAYSELYRIQTIRNQLSLKVHWQEQQHTLQENETFTRNLKKNLKKVSFSKNPAFTFLYKQIVQLLNGEKNASFKEFKGLIKSLFEEQTTEPKKRAAEWTQKFNQFIDESAKITVNDWVLRSMSEDFQAEYTSLLQLTAQYVMQSYKRGGNISNNPCDSEPAAYLLYLVYQNFVLCQRDFVELFRVLKKLRPNLKKIKQPFTQTFKSLMDQLSIDQLRSCWYLAHSSVIHEHIAKVAALPKSIADQMALKKVDGILALWGFDALKDNGLTSSEAIGTSNKDNNPRIPLLINTDLWDAKDGLTLTPKALHIKDGTVTFGKEVVTRDQHATALVDDDGNTVAVICESLSIMRLLLGFDRVKIAKSRLIPQKALTGSYFKPISDFWENKLDGNWTRYAGRVRGINLLDTEG